jgi:hypothetical protein
VIDEVAVEMDRRDPAGVLTRIALTDGERALRRATLARLAGGGDEACTDAAELRREARMVATTRTASAYTRVFAAAGEVRDAGLRARVPGSRWRARPGRSWRGWRGSKNEARWPKSRRLD